MVLPTKIQQMADEAKRLQKEIAAEKTPGNPETQEPNKEAGPAPNTPEAAALKQDAAQVTDVTPKEVEAEESPGDGNPDEETTVAEQEGHEEDQDTVAAEEAGEEKKEKGGEEYWKARFKSLEGKYKAEVPRYTQELKELKQTLQGYEAEIRRLRDELAAQGRTQPEEPASSDTEEIDPNVYEEYGDEMKALAEKLNWAIKTVNSLRDENKTLKDQVGGVYQQQSQRDYQHFLNQIRQQYPVFDQQDTHPEFLSWIEEMGIDLNKVAQDRDVEKAIKIYKAWPGASALLEHNTSGEPPPEADKKKSSNVNKQVAPPRSKPTPPPPSGGATWTREDIRRAYNDIREGKYTDAQAMQIKADIFKAQTEGRVTG